MERDEVFEDENVKKGTLSIEQIFESQSIPSWREQLTLRAFVVSLVLGFFFSFIVMKLNLTTGIIPSLNVAAGLLGFFFLKTWTKLLQKSGLLKQPFTRQENTVIQTCVVATSGIAFSGGFGSYIFGMSETIASQSGDGNKPVNIKNPSLGWMIGFLFVVSFLGLFSVLPLRKIMIIDHKLIYPSGTATAHLINSFHTPHGAKLVKKQVSALFKCFVSSFLWAFFQWFYTAGDDCGFAAFPTFGLQAYQRKFFFDFSATYVGVGMICPYIVNLSLLAGAILSWGIMWPIIEGKKGDWYSEKLSPSSLHGLQGYKVFIAIAMILGDGLFHFAVVLFKTIHELCIKRAREEPSSIIPVAGSSNSAPSLSYDDHRRTEIFLKDQIPITFTSAGYVILAIVSIVTVPHIFPQLKWYHILVTYLIAPVLAFCNSYGCGLTDWSLASSYGKIAIFIFGAWVGLDNGGVLAGLASCGVMMSIVSTASDLMQDFKTGYMTLSSPRSMFVSQVIGTAMGCVIAPCVFWIFYKAFSIGVDGSDYPAPYATVYRGIALLGVEGVSSLPKNCLTLCLIFFLAAIVMSSLKEVAKHYEMKIFMFMPSVMAMAIPFFLGSYFAIDMCLGSLILFMWERMDKEQADAFAPAVASGIICGDGIWALPASLFALAKVKPPICMKFLSRGDNAKVDAFLSG
ncbi:probable metal-nicotianamine transporter YSL7 [Magnolia sinica]|uniref:probable metal-nicotianamine transporter YSL7 n=1 Tax=Magnolia sinica TaxID=86752 RepID=UPI002659CC65|nr:probable metal-nicotianamine transporter YSL7 [Magnolia sinica]